jgi:channel protein (hemolysin III family)
MPASLPISISGFTDPVSSLSHLVGAAVFGALSIPLVRKGMRVASGQTGRVLSLSTFALSAVSLLSLSGVYHMLSRDGTAREVLQRLDHAAIFILIAGTFTPPHSILFRGPWRWGMLAFIWTFAVLGVTLKTVYFASTPQGLGIGLYLCMGWCGAISMAAIVRHYPARLLIPLVLGGLVYTAGAVVEWADFAPAIDGVIRSHEIFHLLVLIGLALHWRFVWSIAELRPYFDISTFEPRPIRALAGGVPLKTGVSP